MSKKVVMLIIGIVICVLLIIFLIGYFNFKSEGEKYEKKAKVIQEGMDLIRNGKYEEGLAKCNEFDYQTNNICYSYVFSLKKEKNETIEKEFCQTIPTKFESNRPFILNLFMLFNYPNEAEKFENLSQQLIKECNQASISK